MKLNKILEIYASKIIPEHSKLRITNIDVINDAQAIRDMKNWPMQQLKIGNKFHLRSYRQYDNYKINENVCLIEDEVNGFLIQFNSSIHTITEFDIVDDESNKQLTKKKHTSWLDVI